jgi:hypothetical protein
VPHAPEYGAGRDAAPEPVGDSKLSFDDEVPDVVRERGPGTATLQPVDHSVVAFDERVGDLVVRETRKRDTHKPTMRIRCAPEPAIFCGALARRVRRR